jgi:hypothetical protein
MRVVEGFDYGMPSYSGLMTETELESTILFIKTLAGEE